MSPPTLSTDPRDRMGIYKRLSDVPDRHRLSQFGGQIRGQDAWEDFLNHYYNLRGDSQRKRNLTNRAERNWKQFMADQGRHYALTTPKQVEDWSDNLLAEYTPSYAYTSYWAVIERLYKWLQWHTDYPHRYNPFWMAASSYEATNRLWNIHVSRPRNTNDQ